MDAQYNHSLMRSNEILDYAMYFSLFFFWTSSIKSTKCMANTSNGFKVRTLWWLLTNQKKKKNLLTNLAW